jgi:hypothetical protein
MADPERSHYLRELARECEVPLRAVQRELARYHAIGLVERMPRGREVYFRVVSNHPLFAGLRALVLAPLPETSLASSPPAREQERPTPVTSPPRPATPTRRADGWRVW